MKLSGRLLDIYRGFEAVPIGIDYYEMYKQAKTLERKVGELFISNQYLKQRNNELLEKIRELDNENDR